MTEDERNEKRQYKAERKVAKQVEDAIDSVYARLTDSWEGRQFLWHLLSIGKVGLTPFASSREHTDFQCGELNVGNQIFARLLNVAADGYLKMVKEKQNAGRIDSEPDAGIGDE